MVLSDAPAALRGALGFLTRLPVGHDEAGWDAFRTTPWTFPAVGYLVSALAALALLVPAPAPTVAFAFVLAVYLVTGINHLDGVADLGDAAVVHGTSEDRRAVLKDTTVGVGAVLAVALVVLGLGLAGLGLAAIPLSVAVALVVASEVGSKAATGLLVCLGTATHEGLGSALTEASGDRDAIPVLALSLPAVLVGLLAGGVAPLLAVLAALLTGVACLRWARTRLGGVSGDVFGATNELARVVALHVGVLAWTRF